MEKPYIVDQKFEKESTLAIGEYEHCVFKNCQFESEDFKNFQFVDCTFESCNLSLIKLSGASLQKVHFKDCKMQGLRFEACNPFLFEVTSFYQIKGKKTKFSGCSLHEVDFTEADFSEATFDDCDLAGALFDQTNVSKADFRSAFNYVIHPSLNQIKKAKFSQDGLAGLLQGFDIHIS
ncbi:MAG: Adenylate cyclase [Bacteroidota bacterium]